MGALHFESKSVYILGWKIGLRNDCERCPPGHVCGEAVGMRKGLEERSHDGESGASTKEALFINV
jgi:hypothetical protein